MMGMRWHQGTVSESVTNPWVQFPPTSQIHTDRGLGHAKLLIVVTVCAHGDVMERHPIQGEFSHLVHSVEAFHAIFEERFTIYQKSVLSLEVLSSKIKSLFTGVIAMVGYDP